MQLGSIPESQLHLLSALTASTQLSSIVLEESGEGEDELTPHQPIPRGGLQHMTPEGRQWPLLHMLHLETVEAPTDVNNACVDASDFSRLAAALPALKALWLCCVLDDTPGAEAVAALAQHMTGVKGLFVAGRVCDDRAAALLAQMTQLTFLGCGHTDITSVGLQKLTALTQLEHVLLDSVQRAVDGQVPLCWRPVLERRQGPGVVGEDGIEIKSSPEVSSNKGACSKLLQGAGLNAMQQHFLSAFKQIQFSSAAWGHLLHQSRAVLLVSRYVGGV
jgi:hypothetical protein